MNGHPYQLRRVELRDFKSVAHASVELRPLTVVVGANSSGKSTLLQSILAVAQAVRAGTDTAEFPLNGEFVRLGTFEETRNFLASRTDSPIEIAFELVDASRFTERLGALIGRDGDQPLTQMTWRAYVGDQRAEAGSDEPSGFARLESLQIEVGSLSPDGDGELTPVLSCDVSEFGTTALGALPMSLGGRLRRFEGRPISASGRVQDWETGVPSTIDAVVLAGGVPQSLLRKMAQFDRLAEVWWNVAHDLLVEELDRQRREVGDPDRTLRVNKRAIRQASNDIDALDLGGSSASPDIAAGVDGWGEDFERLLVRRLGQLTPRERTSVAQSIVQLGELQFRDQLRDDLRDEPWIENEVLVEQSGGAGEALWRCGLVSQRFFHTSVRYLGPLREAPHVLYDPGPSKLDLGVRGEYAAGVLHAQAQTRVLMPTMNGVAGRSPLCEALDEWLQAFGLAERAKSADRGRMGIGLSVVPRGLNREVDLTSVGVGVSQILPVLLLCLLAEPGDLVLLEQPELHLHPKLQQDLADFLVACARSGRQLVIETHSEHLVNQLRYRIASDDSDEVHDLIGLVFAENDDGVTSYREPEVNPYGGLGQDWPAGFLDLTARQSQDLVQSSLAKRKRESALDPD